MVKEKTLVKVNSGVVALASYNEFLKELKEKIRNAELKAAITASRELIQMFSIFHGVQKELSILLHPLCTVSCIAKSSSRSALFKFVESP